MRFILKGKAYDISKEEVGKKMKGIQPEPIRKYFIIVNGVKFPPKQIIAEVLDLGRVEFTTLDAVNILQRLGFEIGRL